MIHPTKIPHPRLLGILNPKDSNIIAGARKDINPINTFTAVGAPLSQDFNSI